MKKKKKIKTAVVGGGFTGLAAAYTFSKAGHEVTLYEKDNTLGGLAGSFKTKKFELEKFYHMWYGTDNEIFNFIKKIKTKNKLKKINSRVAIYLNESVHNFSKPIHIIKFKPLSKFSRLKFIFFIFKCWFFTNPKKLESISCEKWIIKSANKEIYDIIWKPLLIGKFGKFYNKISAIWLWNKIVIRGKSRNIKNSSEHLFYYKGGFSSLVNDIKKILILKKNRIKLNEKILSIRNIRNKKVELKSQKSKEIYHNVLLTNHTPEIIDLFKNKNPDYCKKLKKIKYLSNVCVILVSKKSLTNYYWLNINDTSFPFVGIIEHTNFVNKRNYNNKNLIYLSKYLSRNDKIFKFNNKQMFNFTIKALKNKFPKFNVDDVEDYFVWKADYAQPITSLNYPKILPEFTTPLKNVYVSTMSQVYPEDRGTNQAVRHGIKSATKILNN